MISQNQYRVQGKCHLSTSRKQCSLYMHHTEQWWEFWVWFTKSHTGIYSRKDTSVGVEDVSAKLLGTMTTNTRCQQRYWFAAHSQAKRMSVNTSQITGYIIL